MAQRVAVRIDYHLLTNGPSLFILPFWFRQAQHQVWLAWIVDGLRHSGWPQARVGIESGMLVLRFV